ncbi:MAG: hypothetical protein ABJ205_04035 [Erythrobacter sp.]|uniref:hypothetical protein n=3 Tax=Erythrobacter sp. TaxID=1042 RepID=UPI003299E456
MKNSAGLLLATGLLAACSGEPSRDRVAQDQGPKPQLGLMTSMPLYWPVDADFGALASGEAAVPAQPSAFEQSYELVLLDTLSPIAGLTADEPEVQPLSELDFLAVIQPRVLTPTDNVALDEWVRGGGQLLLVLDPFLNGHYPLPLGDPRRPVETTLIPPVLARWGLELRFDEAQPRNLRSLVLRDNSIPLALTGELWEIPGTHSDCQLFGDGVMARCLLGEGRLTILADAEVFKGDLPDGGHGHEHQEASSRNHAIRNDAIQALVRFAFETE